MAKTGDQKRERMYELTDGFYMWHVSDRNGKQWSIIGDYLGREYDMVARAAEKQIVEEFYQKRRK